jgi:coatomer subunit beta'
VLDVYPLEIWFPFEPEKVIKCPVTLTNKTDDLVGVWITPTSLDARFNPGYPYVWQQHYIEDDRKSSIFRRLVPHSSETIYMTMRKQEQPLLEAADKGMFDVVMVATKSEKDLKRLDRDWKYGRWRWNKSEDPMRIAKELGTVVHLAMLRAAVTSDLARCQEVAAHQVSRVDWSYN